MGLFDKLFGRREDKVVELDGVGFPVTSDIGKFCEIATINKACVLLIKTREYGRIRDEVFRYFVTNFGINSDLARSVAYGRLICSGCEMEFSGIYTIGLADPELFGHSIHATGECPKCGGTKSYYVYENLYGEEITQKDVDAIRKYHHHLARQWWKVNSSSEVACEECWRALPHGTGYLFGSYFYCENCYRKYFSNALKELRNDPYFFGTGLVNKARHFVAKK